MFHVSTSKLFNRIGPTAQPINHFERSGSDILTSDAIDSSMEQESRQLNFPFLQGLLQFVGSVASAIASAAGEFIPPILRPTRTTITEVFNNNNLLALNIICVNY